MKINKNKLDEFLQTHVPASQYMGIETLNYDNNALTLRAPLEPNINDKQTAFGGSLYCTCVLACWGMLYLKTQEAGLKCDQVVTESNISFLAPVSGEIIASCNSPSDDELAEFFKKYEEKGRARLSLKSSIESNGVNAVTFSGSYAIRKT